MNFDFGLLGAALAPESRWTPPTVLPSLKGVRRLAIDTETRDPDLRRKGPGEKRRAHIIGRSIAWEGGPRLYIPTRHDGGCNCDPAMVDRWQRDELDKFDGELVGARLSYDLGFLGEEGVTFPHVRAFHDVQVAEPLIDGLLRSFSLDAISQRRLGEGKEYGHLREVARAHGWDDDEMMRRLGDLPASDAAEYAEGDVDRPLRILPVQLKLLEAEGLLPLYEIERKLIPILAAMRRRGVRVDIEGAQRVRERLVRERDGWLAWLKRLAGKSAELRAVDSFAAALKEQGLEPPVTAKKGDPSIRSGWLKAHSHIELCKVLYEGRRVDTIINTFIDGHILGNSVNGRIHCVFNQLPRDSDGGGMSGTVTGRFSSEHPNLQNLPSRDEELGPLVRGLFLPDEGEEWEAQDQSQMEWRYLAHFAVGRGSEEARRKYNDDPTTDFHAMCADMLGADRENSVVRKRVKNTNFCRVYGGGRKRIAETFGTTEEEAERFINSYDRQLPFVKETYNAADRSAKHHGFVLTVLGRKQRFPKAGDEYDWTYRALNYKLQGSNADHMKKAMVDCAEAGLYDTLGAPLVTVHDELGMSCPRTEAGAAAAAEVKRITETCIKLRVPVQVKSKRGPNWGACG